MYSNFMQKSRKLKKKTNRTGKPNLTTHRTKKKDY